MYDHHLTQWHFPADRWEWDDICCFSPIAACTVRLVRIYIMCEGVVLNPVTTDMLKHAR